MGPLQGISVVEMGGLGPCPFAAMLLADLGADVVRIDRLSATSILGDDPTGNIVHRNRRSIAVDLRAPGAVDCVLRLTDRADVLLEGFRPGVMERLGLGPDTCHERNQRLVYGRMTGWGQDGPLAHTAGHDIDYIALAGALGAFARQGQAPVPPLNLLGDFGGGALFLALGVVSALLERARSGRGQVVDAAIVDGTAVLMTMVCSLVAQGLWNSEPGTNVVDTGAPFYDVYETADGRYLAVGAIEPKFFSELLDRIGLTTDAEDLRAGQMEPRTWPTTRGRLAEVFQSRTRTEWCELLDGTDACVAPVLSLTEAVEHPHLAARSTYRSFHGVVQPAPAPRFSRTPSELRSPPSPPGGHTHEVLAEAGFGDDEIALLVRDGAVATAIEWASS